MADYFVAIVLLVTTFAGCSIPDEPVSPPPAAPVVFSERDRQLIIDFYSKFEFPPAIADPSVISPDLEERLEATAKVPPGIGAEPLPVALEKKLSPLPPGYVRFRAGSAVILMDVRLWEVIDQVEVQFR